MEKILTRKSYHQIIRMEDNGIGSLYIDGLMGKLVIHFEDIKRKKKKSVHCNIIFKKYTYRFYTILYWAYHFNYKNTYRNTEKIFHSNIQLQQVFSSHFGSSCISFILCLENNIPLHRFLFQFIVSQKTTNKASGLTFFDQTSINDIWESI